MTDQKKRMLQYEINGKSIFFILKGQSYPIIIGKLEHRPEYKIVKGNEDVIGLFGLLKEICNTSQGGSVTDDPTKYIRSLRTLVTTKQQFRRGKVNETSITTEFMNSVHDRYDSTKSQCGQFMFGLNQHNYILSQNASRMIPNKS